MQELLLRLVEDHYPLPSNPSQQDPAPSTTHPHPPGADKLPSKAEGTAAGRVDRKRKSSSRGAVEVSPKSRRTKRSIKASKGFGEGQQGKSELEDEAYGDGETADRLRLACWQFWLMTIAFAVQDVVNTCRASICPVEVGC